jgi:hypothetical protein
MISIGYRLDFSGNLLYNKHYKMKKRGNKMNKEIHADIQEIIKLTGLVIPQREKDLLARLANQKPGQFTPRGNKAK